MTVHRHPERAEYAPDTVRAILDEGLICHVALVGEGGPLLPMAYARVGSKLYLHGSIANGMLRALAEGSAACVSVTLVDGLVLAASEFSHSINFRSVMLFGRGQEVTEPTEWATAAHAVVDRLTPGRSGQARHPTPKEIQATRIVSMPIDEASAKVRIGGPKKDTEDPDRDVWTGVVPLSVVAGPAQPEPGSEQRPLPRVAPFIERPPTSPLPTIHEGYEITTDASAIDFEAVYRYLSEESYWARGITRERMAKAIQGSICFVARREGALCGFARVVTDRATFAYLCDVFVLEAHRGHGLGKALVAAALAHPDLEVRRWMLATRDAQGLYARFGFVSSERAMERVRPYAT